MDRKCGNCIWNEGIECHRFPPVWISRQVRTVIQGEWQFPKVKLNWVCGEHTIRETSDV